MIDTHCGYCVKGEPLAKFGIYICDLSVSMLPSYSRNRAIPAAASSPTRTTSAK